MTSRHEPIPIDTRLDGPARVGEQWGRLLGSWVREISSWRKYADRAASSAREMWEDVQEPRRRERHVWTLLALAACAGVVLGALIAKPRE